MQLFYLEYLKEELLLSSEESKHATKVLRKKEGDVWRDEVLNFRRQDLPKISAILTEIQKELFLINGGSENE